MWYNISIITKEFYIHQIFNLLKIFGGNKEMTLKEAMKIKNEDEVQIKETGEITRVHNVRFSADRKIIFFNLLDDFGNRENATHKEISLFHRYI